MKALFVLLLLVVNVAMICVGSSVGAETVRDRLWIWGHPRGVYNDNYLRPLGKKSTLEPVAAAEQMGLHNIIFVRFGGPAAPFDAYYTPFRKLDRVYWSLVAVGGSTSQVDRDAAFSLAEKNPNVTGFILDDFFHEMHKGNAADPMPEEARPVADQPKFRASLSPAELHALGERKVSGRKLPIMAVVYTQQVKPRARSTSPKWINSASGPGVLQT